MKNTMTKRWSSLAARMTAVAMLLIAVSRATVVDATMMLPASLPDAVHESGCIVHGTVAAVHSGRDERGLPATWVTIDATKVLKGAEETAIRFKQFGAVAPLPDGAPPSPDLPRYEVGEEVVLLLRRPSTWGFTSPVDLQHGVRVVRSAGGEVAGGAAAIDEAELRAYLDRLAELVAAER